MPSPSAPRWLTLALAAAGGVVTDAAFPSRGWWGAAFVGVALLVVALGTARPTTARWAAVLGFVYGLAFFLPHLWWASEAVGPIPWVALSVAEAAFIGLVGAAWAWARRWRAIRKRVLMQVVAFTGIWVALEELRSAWPFEGFPWGRLAFSQSESMLARVAWLGGTPLVSAAVVAIGFLLGIVVIRLVQLRPGAAGTALVVACGLLAGSLLVPLDTRAETGRLQVGAVQGNVPEPGLDAFAERRRVLHDHAAGTHALLDQVDPGHLDVVLWPENASDLDPRQDAEAGAVVESAAAAVGAPILVGTLEYPPEGGRYNSALLWAPGVGPIDEYHKQHPAPFAEYIPMRSIARLFSPEVDRVRTDMLPGAEVGAITLPVPRLERDVVLGVAICFEVAYDALVRDAVRAGAELLVIPTNNASFGFTAESAQQLAMTRLRAVEHGRATVQISTVGISGVVAPNGVLLERTGHFTAEQMVASLPLRTTLTPATRMGPWVAWAFNALGALVVAAGIGAALRDRRSPGRHDSPSRPGRSGSPGRTPPRGAARGNGGPGSRPRRTAGTTTASGRQGSGARTPGTGSGSRSRRGVGTGPGPVR